MAKFETIVRPVVFPEIRPSRARDIKPQDDPEQGFAVIEGGAGQVVSLPFNFSEEWSLTRAKEIKRRVDEVRVYKMDENGNVEEDVWIDLYVTNKLWMKEPGASFGVNSATGVGGTPGGTGDTEIDSQVFLQKQKEKKNIKIRKENIIITPEST